MSYQVHGILKEFIKMQSFTSLNVLFIYILSERQGAGIVAYHVYPLPKALASHMGTSWLRTTALTRKKKAGEVNSLLG